MAITRKKKTIKKSKSPRSQTSIAWISRSEANRRCIRAIMKMRNENNTNNMPPEYLKNVERMMKQRGLNKDGSPIFYDALSSHQQNDNNTNNSESDYESTRRSQSTNNNENSFMVVGQKGKRKTKKEVKQKSSKGSNTKRKSPKSSPVRKASQLPPRHLNHAVLLLKK
jgi:hypothetical protein